MMPAIACWPSALGCMDPLRSYWQASESSGVLMYREPGLQKPWGKKAFEIPVTKCQEGCGPEALLPMETADPRAVLSGPMSESAAQYASASLIHSEPPWPGGPG